jgi:hypothetical protein
MPRAFIAAAAALILTSCGGDSCSSYSEYTCAQIDAAEYNVYFYYPDDREEYIGRVSGLQACQSTASNYASQRQLGAARWGYVCCMITETSSCQEKHR